MYHLGGIWANKKKDTDEMKIEEPIVWSAQVKNLVNRV